MGVRATRKRSLHVFGFPYKALKRAADIRQKGEGARLGGPPGSPEHDAGGFAVELWSPSRFLQAAALLLSSEPRAAGKSKLESAGCSRWARSVKAQQLVRGGPAPAGILQPAKPPAPLPSHLLRTTRPPNGVERGKGRRGCPSLRGRPITARPCVMATPGCVCQAP